MPPWDGMMSPGCLPPVLPDLTWMAPPQAFTFPVRILSSQSLVFMLIALFTCLRKKPFWKPAPSTFVHYRVLPTCSLHCASVCNISRPSLQAAFLLPCIDTSLPELAECSRGPTTSQDPLPFSSIVLFNEWMVIWVDESTAYYSFLRKPQILSNCANVFVSFQPSFQTQSPMTALWTT